MKAIIIAVTTKLVVTDSTLTVQMHTNEELLRLTRILRSTWPHLCKTCHV